MKIDGGNRKSCPLSYQILYELIPLPVAA